MASKRTLKRRRQRDKRTPRSSGHTFMFVDWLIRDHVETMAKSLKMADAFNRPIDRRF